MIVLFAVSWSGGKDCCSAYWKAVSEGFDVQYLLNTYREDSERVAFHGVRAELIRRQAKALGKTLVQKTVGYSDYEETFFGALVELKSKGVEGMIFGDIDVRQNREWCEDVTRRAGLESVFPLWNMDQKKMIEEFIGAGFKAIVVALDSKFLTKDDLGRKIDQAWLRRIERLRIETESVPITYCGENGEYHSFVFGGPIFKSDIKIRLGTTVRKDSHWLVDVLDSSGSDEANFSTTSNI
ncbi:MAG: diphthine--ammonia ligase [Candidatus Thermoplasmatota archaeon]|nr:diphthine--ammonia ligase [Candidatus Thermoplasmatota archaeon]